MSNPAIAVSIFGPIRQGRVELRPLTLFAGPSDTGKSWLATLIYALYRHDERASRLVMGADEIFWDFELNKPLFPEQPEHWLDCIASGEPIKFTPAEQRILNMKRAEHLSRLRFELGRCYGVTSVNQLVQEGCDHARVNLDLNFPGADLTIHQLQIGSEISYAEEPTTGLIKAAENLKFLEDIQLALEQPAAYGSILAIAEGVRSLDGPTPMFRAGLVRLIRSLVHLISSNIVLSPKAWYLPADRGGIMHTHAAMVSNLIQNASNHHAEPAVLTGILSDFLDSLVRLARSGRLDDRVVEQIGESLEQRVLGGHVTVDSGEISYPRFYFTPNGWQRSLSLLNVSSMVSELAPVALYLRNYVAPGELLILEEPEAHLHPAKQVEFVREIATWVNAGIRVLLTTHSEWVLDEVSNLVAEHKAGKPSGLKQQDVGVWLFKKVGDKGSIIDGIDWDLNERGYQANFFNVAAGQHNRWVVDAEKIEAKQ